MQYINIMGRKIKIIKKEMKDYGQFHGDNNQIWVKKSLKGEELQDTITHESIHAILFYSGISWLINNEDIEEAIVRFIEYNFLPIFKNIYKVKK